jgi:hypothetical protein
MEWQMTEPVQRLEKWQIVQAVVVAIMPYGLRVRVPWVRSAEFIAKVRDVVGLYMSPPGTP